MGLGTKNRLQQTAEACKEHLRTTFAAQAVLVEDYIREIEGSGKNHDVTNWSQFSDLAHDNAAMFTRLDERFCKWLNGEV